ncbi:MAG: hypothetical protein JWO38_1840 [Gemmataceae bacterium]|nr:hypothetical protein [Gemmataceae bacterium]
MELRPGGRVRPGVVGAVLVAGGFGMHLAYAAWAATYAGRVEMVEFACCESCLFLTGLGLIAVQLGVSGPGGGWRTAAGWALLAALGFASAVAVLYRLPP